MISATSVVWLPDSPCYLFFFLTSLICWVNSERQRCLRRTRLATVRTLPLRRVALARCLPHDSKSTLVPQRFVHLPPEAPGSERTVSGETYFSRGTLRSERVLRGGIEVWGCQPWPQQACGRCIMMKQSIWRKRRRSRREKSRPFGSMRSLSEPSGGSWRCRTFRLGEEEVVEGCGGRRRCQWAGSREYTEL